MSELDQAIADQPQESAVSTDYSSFLGTEPEMTDPAESTPEPSAEEVVTAEPEAETEAEVQPEAEAEEASTSEEDDGLQLSDAEEQYYARRYPTWYAQFKNAETPQDLRQAFIDRVNQDRYIAEQKAKDLQPEEPTLAEETTEPAPADQAKQREQYYASVDSFVKEQIDPQAVEAMGRDLLSSLGVDINSDNEEVKAIVQNASKVGTTLARGAVDLIATSLPALLQRTDAEGIPYLGRLIDQVFPGTLENFERQMYASAWDNVRNSNPAYSKLPAYGTQDGDFGKLMAKVMTENPELQSLRFQGTKQQQAEAQYRMIAKMALGQQLNPVEAAKLVDAGKKAGQERNKVRAAGRALGAGKSTQQFTSPKDDVMDDLDQEIARQNSAATPFRRG